MQTRHRAADRPELGDSIPHAPARLLLGDWGRWIRDPMLVPRAVDAPRPFDPVFNLGMAFRAWGTVAGTFDQLRAAR